MRQKWLLGGIVLAMAAGITVGAYAATSVVTGNINELSPQSIVSNVAEEVDFCHHHKAYNADVQISEAQAKKIVLERVPGATESNISKFKLDCEHGRWEYEGEIRYDGMEYDFSIDANTGAIIEWEAESQWH